MATYSIEMRELVSTFGEDEVKGWFMDYELSDYLTPDEIDVINSRGTWNKEKLAQKIIDHYFMREIGFETPAMFIHKAKVAMQEIMEEKLPLIYSASIKYDPLVNVDYQETYTGSDTNNGSSLSVNSDTPQGQINKQAILAGEYASSTGASEASNTNSQSYTKRVKGNSGDSATAQRMIMQYRENIVMIDRDIINDLSTLFMGVYN